MNSQMLYEAITEISDHYIEEADPDKGSGFMPRIRQLRPVLNMAAALLVVIGISAVAVDMGLFGKAEMDAPAADAAVAQFGLQSEAAYDAPEGYKRAEDDSETVTEEAETEQVQIMMDAPAALAPESAEDCAAEEAPREEPEIADSLEKFTQNDAIELGCPETVVYNGFEYRLQAQIFAELPEDCVETGELSDAEDAVFRTDSESAVGWMIYAAENGEALYLSFENGYILYLK